MRALILIAAASLALAACGDDDDRDRDYVAPGNEQIIVLDDCDDPSPENVAACRELVYPEPREGQTPVAPN